MFISMPSLAYLFLFILTHSQKCNVWTIFNLHVEIQSRLYQLTNENLFLLVPHMYVHKHQPGVQCELGPEANIGKVSRVASQQCILPKNIHTLIHGEQFCFCFFHFRGCLSSPLPLPPPHTHPLEFPFF